MGVSCGDFNATIFRLALDATIGAGDATLSTPACADLSAGGVEISTEVTVALAVAHARGHYGRGAVEAHVVSVLDASALEGHIQAIAAAHGDRRRRLGMSDVSVASVAVDTFMPTPAPTPVPTSGAPIPSPSLAPSDVPIPSPSLAPRLDAAPIPSSRPTGAPMPGSTLAPSAAHIPEFAPTAAEERDESGDLSVTYIVVGAAMLLLAGMCTFAMCVRLHMQAQAKTAHAAMVNVQARAATAAVV